MYYNLFAQFLCVIANVFSSFAHAVPNCQQSVTFAGNEFIAADWGTLQVLSVVGFENKQLNAVGHCVLRRALVNTSCTSTNDGVRLQVVKRDKFSDVGIIYASAAYDCEFHW